MSENDRCDHLILLVGSNPLPNAVAARVLTKPGGRVSLIHSRSLGEEDNRVESRLNSWLEKQGRTVELHQINDESDPSQIADPVNAVLNCSDSDSVGLDYTGGSKALSVHAHQTLRDWAKRQDGSRAVRASYLDPRTLTLIFDPELGGKSICVRDQKIGLQDMVELHGRSINFHHQEVRLPESARMLATVFARPETHRALWETWLLETLFPVARKWVSDKNRVVRHTHHAGVSRHALFPGNWRNKTDLHSIDLVWPQDP